MAVARHDDNCSSSQALAQELKGAGLYLERLMIQRMAYFRVKQLRLGMTYQHFILQNLQPGGTLFIVECGLKWPTTKLGERHIFQFGALGGATSDEYHHGGPRVEEYLRRYHSPRTRWDAPAPDDDRPEAEWGFEPTLRDGIDRFARQRVYRTHTDRYVAPHPGASEKARRVRRRR